MKKEIQVVLYVLHLVVTALAAEPKSPRYDFEEKILERVLRNEIALEQMLSMTKLHEENVKCKTAIQSLSQIVIESGQAIKDMKDNLDRIKGDLKTPTIQFRAQLASTITVNNGQDVVFTRVEVNEGQGYDKGTGKFTASVAGLYNFAVHFCPQGSQSAYLEIVHNDKSLQRSAHHGTDLMFHGSSLQAYIMMSKGDMVWVRTTGTSNFYQSDSQCPNTFSGIIIRA